MSVFFPFENEQLVLCSQTRTRETNEQLMDVTSNWEELSCTYVCTYFQELLILFEMGDGKN